MDEQYTKEMAELQSDHWWYEGRRNILSALIAKMKLPADATILEGGCGPGANLKMLSKFGKVSAFEPDDFSVQHAGSISGLDIKNGTLPNGLPFSESFDLVCAFDVIEHIGDDIGSVKALCDHTKTDGYAIFTVPAFQFLWSHHDDINFHKRRYTKAMLRDVLQKAGYKIEFISYYNFFLFPLAAGIRLLKNALRLKEQGSDVTMPKSNFINKMMIMVFSSEMHLLQFMPLPFGLSVVAVCRKVK